MIDYTYESLFYEDSVDKQLKIEAEDGSVITNEDIFSESMTLDESICSETSLTYGCCESSKFYIKIANRFTSLYGQWLDVSITPDPNSNLGNAAILGEMELGDAVLGYDGYQNREIPFVLGRYKVQSDKPTADRTYREITAYDAMYDIIHADGTEVAEWYNTILPNNDSTTTMKEFRESFIDHFGIKAVSTSLVNDDMVIEKTITTSSLSGQRVIKAICELNGVFGHITRDGEFEYLQLGVIDTSNAYDIPINMYSDYEDFEATVINCLQIREDDSDPGVVYGSGANRYIISGNFLLYGKTTSDLLTVTENLYPVVNKITYRPATIESPGNPCLEVGDVIHLSTKYQEIYTYILKRNLSGIQALTDNYISDGTETYVDNGGSGSVEEQIEQIKSRTAELANEIDTQEERLNVVVETIEADYGEFLVLVAEVANIQTLFAEYATIEELEAAIATIEDLYVTYEEVNTILADYALVIDLEAAYGYIEALNSDIADILFLLAGNAGVGSLEAIHLTTANAIIDEAVITEALINTVLADIIQSNIIYTDTITIMSENGGIIISGTTMQFSDSNGTVRLQLGEDADGNFTFVLYDETGTGIMIDSEGIHASAVPDGLIVDSMVADDANISGYKLNIDEVTQILNEQGQLQMNATQITIDGETLDYRLTQMTQEIAAIEAMGIESVVNYYALGGKDEPPCDPDDPINDCILGEMILGESPLGFVGWTTERLVAGESEYLWYCQKITYVDGTVVWTTPTLITDDWIRSTVSTAITELEVIQGQIEAKVWETDIETATSGIWEQLITIEENYADIVINLNSITETVSNLITTESDHYISLSSEVSNITIELGSITSTVQSVQESIENIENWAVTNTTMEYYKSSSITECVGGEWSTTAPQAEEGYYIWMRVSITYGIGTESRVVTTDPICLTALGEENLSVISIVPYYSVSNSPTWYQPHGTENPALVGTALVGTAMVGLTGIWTTEQPEITEEDYLWECFLVTYTNGYTIWTEPTCLTDVVVKDQIYNLEESYSKIEQTINSITLTVSATSSNGALGGIASIVMTVGDEAITADLDLSNVRQAFADDESSIVISAGTILFLANTFMVDSDNLVVEADGKISATNGIFSGTLISFEDSDCAILGSGELGFYSDNYFLGNFRTVIWSEDYTGINNLGISLRAYDAKYISFSYYRSSSDSGIVTMMLNFGLYPYGITQDIIMFGTLYCDSTIDIRTGYAIRWVDRYSTNYGARIYCENSILHIYASDDIYIEAHEDIYMGTNNDIWIEAAEDIVIYAYGDVDITAEDDIYLVAFDYVYVNGNYYRNSDKSLKKNIKSLNEAAENKVYEKVDRLEPVEYEWNKDKDNEHTHYGYIANDVQKVMPELVSEEKDGTLALAYEEIIPLLHLKIKQLESRIEQLEQAD